METGKPWPSPSRREVIELLRKDIAILQGLPLTPSEEVQLEMGRVLQGFPGGIFPTATIHEYISYTPEGSATSGAFIAATVSALKKNTGACIWIGRRMRVYPPALNTFGVDPDKVVFVKVAGQKEAIWATEEVLKTPGITAVVAEIPDLSFTHSRRLQLAVEKTKATGFILRDNPKQLSATAAAARWRIEPAPSYMPRLSMPGLGHPHWQVTLTQVKNGRGGCWHLAWLEGQFLDIQPATPATAITIQRKVV